MKVKRVIVFLTRKMNTKNYNKIPNQSLPKVANQQKQPSIQSVLNNEPFEDGCSEIVDKETNTKELETNEQACIELQSKGDEKTCLDELIKILPPDALKMSKLDYSSKKKKISNNKKHHGYGDDFIDWLLAVKKHRTILINEDIISKEDSLKRINLALFTIAIILQIVSTCLTIISFIRILQENEKTIRYPLMDTDSKGITYFDNRERKNHRKKCPKNYI